MTKLSIKKKLLIYGFCIQSFILIVFSVSLYKSLELSTLDQIENSLKIIILDVADDIQENDNLENIAFNEENEYKFKPLYFRLSKLNKQSNVIKEMNYPKDIITNYEQISPLEKDTISFEKQNSYLITRLKFFIQEELFLLEVATDSHNLNKSLENFLYILFFIIPIILILSTIGGYFIIHKSFQPIEQIINKLKEINVKNLSKRLERLENDDEIDNLSYEINNLLKRLEISFDKITQFSSDASHELKTPLTIMRGEIEITLRKLRSPQEYHLSLNNCLDEVLIIQQTVNDLLYLAQSEDQNNLFSENVYLDEIILESIQELEPLAKLKKVEIYSEIKSVSSIIGNPQLLKIAINNIIKNSINFSHEESHILINSYVEDKWVYLTIEDFGIGISKPDLEKIFEKFYRTDKSRNKNSGGTGLGLSITHKIIENHQGIISFKSEEDEGTIVTMKFKTLEMTSLMF